MTLSWIQSLAHTIPCVMLKENYYLVIHGPKNRVLSCIAARPDSIHMVQNAKKQTQKQKQNKTKKQQQQNKIKKTNKAQQNNNNNKIKTNKQSITQTNKTSYIGLATMAYHSATQVSNSPNKTSSQC